MSQDFIPKTLEFVQIANVFAKKANEEIGGYRQDADKAAELLPEILQKMADSHLIKGDSKEAAERLLNSHNGTMQLLKNAVDVLIGQIEENRKKTASLGAALEKDASDSSSTGGYDNYLGRRTTQKRDSDRALEALLT